MIPPRFVRLLTPATAAAAALLFTSSSITACSPSSSRPLPTRALSAAAQLDADYAANIISSETLTSSFPDDANFVWRSARVSFLASRASATTTDRVAILRRAARALSTARAHGVTRDSAAAHRWEGIILSELSALVTASEAARLAWDTHAALKTALAIDAGDASAAHLLGRWTRAIAEVPEWKRFALRALTGEELPRATKAEACEEFARAERLDPGGWAANLAALATCKESAGDVKVAVSTAKSALAAMDHVKRDWDSEAFLEAEGVLKRQGATL